MNEQPKVITLCKLECVLMPNGELICLGNTIGWFKDLHSCLEDVGKSEDIIDEKG